VALDLDAVAQLCRRLDGLPLAIELAAALTGALSIDEIMEGLDARFQLLTGGRRANARHRSLEAAIDWSYAALSPAEQELFCCCSLFAGRFTAADARALAAPELAADAVAPLLARLVERSMLVRDAAGTFALLETLREYGRRRLAQRARLDTGRDRHARHFVALATRDPAAVDERIDELRAAHRWLLAHGDVAGALELAVAAYRAAVVRMRAEVHEWAQRALAAAADDDSPAAFADACASAAVGAWQSGDLDAADRLARRGLARSYLCEEVLGDVCLFRGDLDGAYDHATRAAERAAAAGDGATEVRSLVNRALARSYAGRHAEAIALAEEVVARADVVGGPAERALALYTDGECRLDVDPQGALARLDRARELARDAGAAFVVGIATVSAASLRSRQGDDTGAIALYSELVDHWWRERVWTQQWTTLRTLVEVLCRVGEHEAAGVLLGAVEHAASTPPFGADADRLARLHEELRAVLGDEPLTAAVARGGALGGEGAVDFARRTLRRLHARAAGGGG
jgi:tetratricopeptide (TPR) repeat protein